MSKILTEFKNALIQFLDEMILSFPHEGDLIVSRIFIKDQFPIEIIMNFFVSSLLPHKEMVVRRDEKFFLENDVMFKGLHNEDKVNHFKRLWTSPHLDSDEKEIIFKWFDLFLGFAEKYVNRDPNVL